MLESYISGEGEPQSLFSMASDTNMTEPKNDLIEQCLDRAILAFTARWLPPRLQNVSSEGIATSSWRTSRSDMLILLNSVSYRSVLALYLFAHTPVPVDVSAEEGLRGISGSTCMQGVFLHIQRLRQRRVPGEQL